MSFEQLAQQVESQFLPALLIITRLGAALFAVPPLDVASVPRQVKALLLLALGFLIVPVALPANPLPSEGLIQAGVLLGREILLGLLIGLTVKLLLQGLQLVGELAATLGGVQTGEQLDLSTNTPVPVVSRLTAALCAVIFLGLGGHRWMLEGLLQSFRAMPPGQFAWQDGFLQLLLQDVTASLVAGLQAGAPLVVALLLSNLVTGLISRTLPQLNVLIVGFHLNALVLLSILFVSIGSVGLVYQQHLEAAWDRLVANLLVAESAAPAIDEPDGVEDQAGLLRPSMDRLVVRVGDG
jgi:flagellar biosynthetic protein FliR